MAKTRKDLQAGTGHSSYRRKRERFLTEWDGPCHWCRDARAVEIDHVVPVDAGIDPTDQTNWVGSCKKCNAKRGADYLAAKRHGMIRNRQVNQGIASVEPRKCEQCGTVFVPDWRNVERGGGRYCSKPCSNEGKKLPRVTITKTYRCSVCSIEVVQTKQVMADSLDNEKAPARQTCGDDYCLKAHSAAKMRDKYREKNPSAAVRPSKYPELTETEAAIVLHDSPANVGFSEAEQTMPPTPIFCVSENGQEQGNMAEDGRALTDPAKEPGIAPRLQTATLGGGSYGPQVAKVAQELLGVDLMPWQLHALNGQLEHDDEGNLIRRRSLVSVARQNGKTMALKALILWALTEEPKRRGGPIMLISTAHQLDLAVEIFEALAPILDKKFSAKVKWSYGRNEVIMPDGTRWLVQAATPKAFHGLSPTYVIADEVWAISRDVLLNGALPSQRVMKSPLLSCWSTAGTEDSLAMLQMREEGLRAIDEGRTTKLYMAEWSVPPGIDPMTSPDLWKMANPALGYTLEPEVLADEAEQVDKAAFLRASLNVWISSERSWLPPGTFDRLKVDQIPAGGVLAVDSSMDESLYCGVRAQRVDDDIIGVTVEFLADSLSGCWKAIEAVAGTCDKVALTPSLFDIAPPALERKKVQVGYAELATHTGTIRQLITEGRIVHTGEQMLAEHVDRAVGVKTQRGYALSSQRSSGPITLARCMIFAASLVARPQSRAKPAIAFGR